MPKSALHPKETVTRTGALLPGSRDIELINASIPVGHVRSVLFDFDGTVSLIREGWRDIMIPMMVEILADLGGNETGDQLHAVVSEFVDRLTGRQTIYQMVQLAEEVTKRGGTPADPLEYKRQYNDRLLE
ncbi:MAG: hypothetical protein QGI83_14860, partial [Candidatus Latescibacteria bacterium]|nr:hypothetical protein [Candidatus Latescibacterota bacterium]